MVLERGLRNEGGMVLPYIIRQYHDYDSSHRDKERFRDRCNNS